MRFGGLKRTCGLLNLELYCYGRPIRVGNKYANLIQVIEGLRAFPDTNIHDYLANFNRSLAEFREIIRMQGPVDFYVRQLLRRILRIPEHQA